jgi:tetratricopeptide (TPR) repeat protein
VEPDVSPRPTDLPDRDDFGPALRLAREGRIPDAIARLERVVAERERDEPAMSAAANALARIARIAEAAERPADAEAALAAAVRLRPDYPDLRVQHARLLLQRGRRAEARAALDAALRINPGYAAARVERALLDARDGLIGEALQALRSLAKECRIEEAPAFEQGLERLKEADVGEAEAFLGRALRLEDPVLEERLDRYRRLLDDGEAAQAAHLIREVLPRYERYPDLHFLLGRAELGLGHPDDALASFARALELHADFHAARVQLACALHATGQTAQATEQLQLVVEADPARADARALLERWDARPRSGSAGRRHA